ncbi:pentatricopeptide repeat-containing protein At4g02750-like [Fagus crenata]
MIIRRFFQFHFSSFSTLSPLQKTHLFQCNKTIQDLSKLGRVAEARHMFDSMPHRDPGSWNTMISGYTQNGLLHEAQTLFNVFRGKNVRTWTILLTGYSKFGLVDDARMLFEAMPERNVVSWNAMISAYVQNGDLRSARELFDEMPERNVVSWNSMITGYCHCGMMREAVELCEEMGERNLVSWMVMISGFIEISEYGEAWGVFLMMMRSGVRLDQAVLVLALSAVMRLNDLELFESLRTLAIKPGYEGDVVVGTAILDAYTRNGSLDYAVKFFEMMPIRNEYSWTTMIAAFAQCHRLDDAIAFYERDPVKSVATQATIITAYAQMGRIYEARRIFDETPNPNVVMWNAMVAAYAQNGMLEEAKDIFLHIPMRNAASWAAMISGFVQNGHSREALEVFAELHRSGNFPSHSSFSSALFACSNIADVEVGRQIHSLTIKTKCQFNSFVGNGLISMYGKCKSIEDFSQVFSTMRVKDVVSWNSLISRLSENYMLDDAWKFFEKMPNQDVVSWTAVISAYEQAGQGDIAFKFFLGVLCACGHAGFVDKGWAYFHSMSQDYGITPLVYHYTCMVDLLGRAGQISEAEALIQNMPVRLIHRNMEVGQRIAERLFQIGTKRSGTYVLLSNIYASQGMWHKVLEIRQSMKDRGVNKEPGISWIQIKNKLHYFLIGDNTHNEIGEIHLTLKELYRSFRETGYVPDTNFVLHDVEEERKEDELLYHSEKLAIAYGILCMPNGTPIQIMKNLRICGDFHSFMKFVSKVTQRKIVIRDGSRFHHFWDGLCSCGDYW